MGDLDKRAGDFVGRRRQGGNNFGGMVKGLRDLAAASGKADDPTIRQRLMQYYTKIEILRINGLRNLTSAVTGNKDMGTISLGATNKMFWSEMHQAAMELALDIWGAESMLITSLSSGDHSVIVSSSASANLGPFPCWIAS